MALYDGSPEPLTYGAALVEVAKRCSWPSEEHQAEVVKAIQVEHGLYVVPEAETRQLELERLRRLAAEADAVAAEAAREAEIAELRGRLGLDSQDDDDQGDDEGDQV